MKHPIQPLVTGRPKDMTMNSAHAATIQMTLKNFSDEELAAFNNGMSWGFLEPQNIAFDQALDAKLVDRNGSSTFDQGALLAALSAEVLDRQAKDPGAWGR